MPSPMLPAHEDRAHAREGLTLVIGDSVAEAMVRSQDVLFVD